MSTTPITCPKCGAWVRVAVQPSSIRHEGPQIDGQLIVEFHPQAVAHICKPKES